MDAMLDDEGGADQDAPGPGVGRKIDEQLATLRAKLKGKQAEVRSSWSAGAVLVARATDVSLKPKRRKSRGGVLKEFKKALTSRIRGSRDKDDSDDESDEAEEDICEDEGSTSSWQNKRSWLRKLVEESAGKLLASTLQSLHDQLGHVTGEEITDPSHQ